MQPSIAGIVQFLQQYAPRELDRLAASHPEASAHFRAQGEVLGESEDKALSDAALAMLTALADTASSASAETSKKLTSARKLEVTGAVLSLVSSGAVVAAALSLNSVWTAAALGIIGFIANAAPLLVNWLRGSPTGINVGQAMIQLRQCAWEARALHSTLQRSAKWDEDAARIVSDVNELGKKAYSVLAELGYEPRLRPI
jgi:hypothetical protein